MRRGRAGACNVPAAPEPRTGRTKASPLGQRRAPRRRPSREGGRPGSPVPELLLCLRTCVWRAAGGGGRAGVRGAGTVRSRPGGRWPLLLRAPCAEPGGGEERAGRLGSEPPRGPEGRGSASPGFAAAGRGPRLPGGRRRTSEGPWSSQ